MSIADNIIQEAGKRNRSRDWYRGKLMEILQVYQGDEHDDPGSFGEVSGPVEVGEMYFFNYIATKPERLKWYDQFPVTYVMTVFADGFLGANLHYLNMKLREGVALSLLNSGDGAVVPNKTIHRYYFNGVQGNVMRVPESEMAGVSLLPTAKFINRNGMDLPAYRVWRDK
tara:strand:- start:1644 stop:2153 length:510 start_codon:yes stop_codon:yes gene_type:complete